MIITNKFNLPQTFVNVLKRPTYSKGRAALSATELIKLYPSTMFNNILDVLPTVPDDGTSTYDK